MSWKRGNPPKSDAYLTTLMTRTGRSRDVGVTIWVAGSWLSPEGWRVIAWDYLPEPATIHDQGDDFCGTSSQGVVGGTDSKNSNQQPKPIEEYIR